MARWHRCVKGLYLSLIGIVVGIAILTPYFIRSRTFSLYEEDFEVSLIFSLSAFGVLLYWAYKQENIKHQREKNLLREQLNDSFKYIGKMNVALEETKHAFSGLTKIPETKNDYKSTLKFFGEKILSLAPIDCVNIRIIDRASMRTIHEHHAERNGKRCLISETPNKALVEHKIIEGVLYAYSTVKNINVLVFFIFPKKELFEWNKILLQVLANELGMISFLYEFQRSQ